MCAKMKESVHATTLRHFRAFDRNEKIAPILLTKAIKKQKHTNSNTKYIFYETRRACLGGSDRTGTRRLLHLCLRIQHGTLFTASVVFLRF